MNFRFVNKSPVAAGLILFVLSFISAQQAAAAGKEAEVKTDTVKEQVYHVSPEVDFVYARPKPLAFVTSLPKDAGRFCKTTFRTQNIPMIAMIFAETALMIPGDQGILDGAKSIGKTLNIPPTSRQHTIFSFKLKLSGKDINFPISIPSDVNNSMYFLGDGITHTTIALGFWGVGLITKDYRALQTASQIGEAMLASGIVVQTLKHITGRESPFASSSPGGVWRVFPNQADYANHVPHYDAYPSGHIATAVGTVTVIAENYPEYKLVRPIGYSLCGLLAFAMMNNGVHWASDYPLGIALGYTFAKVAVAHGHQEVKKNPDTSFDNRPTFRSALKHPYVSPAVIGGMPGCTFRWSF